MVMVEALLAILIIAILAAGSYYAALKYVELRHNRDTIADDYKRAVETIHELEDRNAMLEAERDSQMTKFSAKVEPSSGWDNLSIRR